MNKFGTIILKILIVLSFVGVIVFTAIAIVNNHNIAFESFNYIKKEGLDFSYVTSRATLVRSEFKKIDDADIFDPYAKFLNDAILELNGGINYFVDYLALEEDVTKGEQNELSRLFDEYNLKYQATKEALDSYNEKYNVAQTFYNNNNSESFYVCGLVKTFSTDFVKKYLDCYKKGSEFFEKLVSVTKKYSFCDGNISYKGLCYEIEVGFANGACEFIEKNLEKKDKSQDYSLDIQNDCINIKNFYGFKANKSMFKDEDIFTNDGLRVFVGTVNELDTFLFAGDFEKCVSKLNDDLKVKANIAKNFLQNIVKGGD